jgi:hypothetical protein
VSEWRPIETAPKGETAIFWVVSLTEEEAPTDTSGNPILSKMPPRMLVCQYGGWSSLSKALYWYPMPAPPEPEEGK